MRTLALAITVLLTGVTNQAAAAEDVVKIEADCQIRGNKPDRSSGLSLHNSRSLGQVSSHSSYIIAYGNAPGVVDADPPQIGVHIYDREAYKSTNSIWDKIWVHSARIEVQLPEMAKEISEETMSVEIAMGGKVYDTISGKDLDLFDNGDGWDGIQLYEVVTRVNADDNERFTQALRQWSPSKTLTLTVRSAGTILTTANFRQQDLIAVRKAAVSDWGKLDDAFRAGRCTPQPPGVGTIP